MVMVGMMGQKKEAVKYECYRYILYAFFNAKHKYYFINTTTATTTMRRI